MGEPLVVDFDHYSKDFLEDRLEGWRRVRRTPVAYSDRYGGFWVVSGYDEVAQVSRDEATFTSYYGERDGVQCQGIVGVPRKTGIPPAGIAEADTGLHAELRRVLNPYLLPPAVEEFRPFVEALTTWFIDQKIESGRMDLVLDVTNPVPAVLTMKLMGLPCDHWQHYAELFHATVAFQPGSDEYDRAINRAPEMISSLLEEVAARRAEPRDDMLTALTKLTDDSGRPVDDATIGAVLWNLVGGGLDTTTSLTSLALHYLAVHPQLRTKLIEQPQLLPTATEEFLRYFSVNETLTRTVVQETELGGQRLCPGDVVLLSWLSANHDEEVFERPGDVVLERSPNRHLAFGIGPHRCIGMHIARSVFQIMASAVLERMPDYQVEPEGTRFYEGNPILAGVVSMPVTFTPGPRIGPAERPF